MRARDRHRNGEQRVSAQSVDDILAPLHEHNRAVAALFAKAEPGDLHRECRSVAAKAVKIGVNEPRRARVMLLHEGECRARNARRNSERARDRAYQERFAGTEPAGQDDEIARHESGRDRAAEHATIAPCPDWIPTAPGIWHIEQGRLCGEHAKNHGIWLKRTLPTNARIEFDAISHSTDGDLKAEYWGDGRSFATALSYTNATSYLTIFGGWHNKYHVLARLNEHGTDRKEITVDPTSDDPREKPVMAGQSYHFKVERTDGKTVKWSVDGVDMLSFPDTQPLPGPGHDHFGFNDWDVRVCFDNVKVVPLP